MRIWAVPALLLSLASCSGDISALMSLTFAVFTAEDGKIVNYRRETPGNFRELECKLGFTPG